eukprot:EG_transcript_15143
MAGHDPQLACKLMQGQQPFCSLWKFLPHSVLGIISVGGVILFHSLPQGADTSLLAVGGRTSSAVVHVHTFITSHAGQIPVPLSVAQSISKKPSKQQPPREESAISGHWHFGLWALLGALCFWTGQQHFRATQCRNMRSWTLAAVDGWGEMEEISTTRRGSGRRKRRGGPKEPEEVVDSLAGWADDVIQITEGVSATSIKNPKVEEWDAFDDFRSSRVTQTQDFEEPMNPNEGAWVILLKDADVENPPKLPEGYWNSDTEVDIDIDYFRNDPHEGMLTSKGYRALCLPVMAYENLYPFDLVPALRSDFCPLYGLVVTDPRALPALKWACNHYFAGTLVRLLKRAQALCPAFAPGAEMCQKLRDLGFVDVYGDDVKDPMDLLPILAAVAVKERH